MRVLLVYPKYPDTFWSFKTVLKYISKKAAFPPLGLLTVAAMLPSDWEQRLVDVNVEELKDADLAWADMVCVSGMLIQQASAIEIIDRAKAMGKIVVGGGPLFNVRWESFSSVDHFVLNEAEVTLPLFLDDLANGRPQRVYRSDVRPDIALTPIPAWHLINMKHYVTMSVQYSRGCPFNCEFCDIIIMNGRVPRMKSPTQMLAELESLRQAGWRGSVFVVDDNFIGNTKTVKLMLPELIAWQKKHHYPFHFLTEASTNLADDEELMRLMSAANFYKVFLGIETPEVDSLKECGKYQNVSRNLASSVKTIQRHGMQVMAGFIVGFDHDSESTFETQIRFIQQVGIVTAMVGMLNAVPHTKLWERLHSEDRLLADSTGENTDGSLNFIPKMGKEQLISGYQYIISQIYSTRNYYERICVFLENYTHTARTHLTPTDIMALVKSMVRIGIFSPRNVAYWRMLIKTLLTNTRALPVVVEMMISGEHFLRVKKRILAATNTPPLRDPETQTPA